MQETTPGVIIHLWNGPYFSWLNYNEELQVAKCETRQVLVTLKAPFTRQYSGYKSNHLRKYVTCANYMQIIWGILIIIIMMGSGRVVNPPFLSNIRRCFWRLLSPPSDQRGALRINAKFPLINECRSLSNTGIIFRILPKTHSCFDRY